MVMLTKQHKTVTKFSLWYFCNTPGCFVLNDKLWCGIGDKMWVGDTMWVGDKLWVDDKMWVGDKMGVGDKMWVGDKIWWHCCVVSWWPYILNH